MLILFRDVFIASTDLDEIHVCLRSANYFNYSDDAKFLNQFNMKWRVTSLPCFSALKSICFLCLSDCSWQQFAVLVVVKLRILSSDNNLILHALHSTYLAQLEMSTATILIVAVHSELIDMFWIETYITVYSHSDICYACE